MKIDQKFLVHLQPCDQKCQYQSENFTTEWKSSNKKNEDSFFNILKLTQLNFKFLKGSWTSIKSLIWSLESWAFFT